MKEEKSKGKHSLIKLLRTAMAYIITQRTVVILLLIAQFVLIFFMVASLERYSTRLQLVFQLLATITAVYIINKQSKNEFKMSWMILLIAFPLFGVVIYFYLSNQYATRFIKKTYAKKVEETKEFLAQDREISRELKKDNGDVYRYSRYMNEYAGYPIHQNSEITYYRCGEDKLGPMIEELKKAKHYIFIEMFIVDQGIMLDEIIDVLKQKVSEGVEVRFIYDGLGSQNLLPFGYDKKLCEMGIQTRIFHPFVPFITSIQNNRDHRKIVVIDGHTGFTGGDNFADEYINEKERFGYWKDTSVMIKGEAVWNLTMMFLQMWGILDPIKPKDAQKKVSDSYDDYRPSKHSIGKIKSDGYVLPYGDSPLDNEDVGMLTYLDILNTATDYCYISSPYLVPGEGMLSAICFAAKRGVDVRIVVPGIPDKWYVKVVGESYYETLIEAGVRVYEYNGFNHAKMFVSDDIKAVVGTINLDHRSFSLHFEDACFFYKMPAVMDVKRDFENMFENECRELTIEECRKRPAIRKLTGVVLKTLEPLL